MQSVFLPELNDNMDVVWHDDQTVQVILLAIKFFYGLSDDSSEVGIPQQTRSVATI